MGNQYQNTIERAEKALGSITRGEATDLLLDRHDELADVQAARTEVDAVFNARIRRNPNE